MQQYKLVIIVSLTARYEKWSVEYNSGYAWNEEPLASFEKYCIKVGEKPERKFCVIGLDLGSWRNIFVAGGAGESLPQQGG